MIHLQNDFFNKAAEKIKAAYFPTVKHGLDDNPKYYQARYTIECFSNGVLNYTKLIQKLAKICKDEPLNIHNICKEFVISFEDFEPNF